MHLRGALRTILLALGWLLLAALLALGAAGVVGAMNHMPASPARPELTWAGDQAAAPALDAAAGKLQQLSDDVDTLGSTARQALAQMVAGDLEGLTATIDDGSQQVVVVQVEAAELEQALSAVPGIGENAELRLSGELIRRYEALASARNVTTNLGADWAVFSGRALDAVGLTAILARHDRETAAAAKEGSAAHYRRALDKLKLSDATIAEARAVRDRLASTTDVTTLTAWIDRNASYDVALRGLYQALLDSRGRVTSAVRQAFDAEQAARAELPKDTRGLVVIMSDVAQGGLNQAVISIEEARGALASALDLQRSVEEGVALPE